MCDIDLSGDGVKNNNVISTRFTTSVQKRLTDRHTIHRNRKEKNEAYGEIVRNKQADIEAEIEALDVIEKIEVEREILKTTKELEVIEQKQELAKIIEELEGDGIQIQPEVLKKITEQAEVEIEEKAII